MHAQNATDKTKVLFSNVSCKNRSSGTYISPGLNPIEPVPRRTSWRDALFFSSDLDNRNLTIMSPTGPCSDCYSTVAESNNINTK